MNERLEDILHYIEINEHVVMGGQPTASQLKLLKQANFDLVIQFMVKEAQITVPDERELLQEMGIQHVAVPVSFLNPQKESADQFLEVMARHRGKRIFVHCVAGFCTSGLIFLYEVVQLGMTQERARSILHRVWNPNDVWLKFVRGYLAEREIAYME